MNLFGDRNDNGGLWETDNSMAVAQNPTVLPVVSVNHYPTALSLMNQMHLSKKSRNLSRNTLDIKMKAVLSGTAACEYAGLRALVSHLAPHGDMNMELILRSFTAYVSQSILED
jgi:hypothetical protein